MFRRTPFLEDAQIERIVQAIADAEKLTSGEIRVRIDRRCWTNPLRKAYSWFQKLEMHKTKQRNAVLFYVAWRSKTIAIYGDQGINAVVPENFWDATYKVIRSQFQQDKFAEGLIAGITLAGEQLATHFPIQDDDRDELPNSISMNA